MSTRFGSGHSGETRWGAVLVILSVVLVAGCRKTTAWSPDGKQISAEAYGGIQLYSPASGDFRFLVPGEPRKHEALAPAWSPDSQNLAFFDARLENSQPFASLVSLEVKTGKRTTLVAQVPTNGQPDADDPLSPVRNVCTAAWSPDGREIAFIAPDGSGSLLWTVPATGGRPRRLTANGRQSSAPTWSPDSRQLVFGDAPAGEGAAWVLELTNRDGTGGKTLCRAPAGLELGSGLQWAPSGKSGGVFFNRSQQSENDPPVCEAWNISVPDGALRKIADVSGAAWSASFTPDLRTIIFLQDVMEAGHKTPTVAALEAPYTRARLLPHPSLYVDPAASIPMISPDGKAISLQIQEGEKPLLLNFRYLDGRGAVDATIAR